MRKCATAMRALAISPAWRAGKHRKSWREKLSTQVRFVGMFRTARHTCTPRHRSKLWTEACQVVGRKSLTRSCLRARLGQQGALRQVQVLEVAKPLTEGCCERKTMSFISLLNPPPCTTPDGNHSQLGVTIAAVTASYPKQT